MSSGDPMVRCVCICALVGACGGGGDDRADGGGRDASAAADSTSAVDAATARRIAQGFVRARNGIGFAVQLRAEPTGPGSCLLEQVAMCELETCNTQDPSSYPSAGTITVSAPGGTSTAQYQDNDDYASETGVAWDANDDVVFTATGGDIPAFEQTLRGPAELGAVTEPDMSEPLVIPRDRDLSVAWSGASGARVVAGVLYELPDIDERVQLRCSFDGQARAGTVPAEALSRLRTDGTGTRLVILAENRVVLEFDNQIEVRLLTRAAEQVRLTAVLE